MSNPGHDTFNMQADDVLAPKRQAEIAEVIAALKNFHPTKVAVEGDVGDDRIPKRYADYLAGKHELTATTVPDTSAGCNTTSPATPSSACASLPNSPSDARNLERDLSPI